MHQPAEHYSYLLRCNPRLPASEMITIHVVVSTSLDLPLLLIQKQVFSNSNESHDLEEDIIHSYIPLFNPFNYNPNNCLPHRIISEVEGNLSTVLPMS